MKSNASTVGLFFVIVALVLALVDKGQIEGDGILRFEALRAMAERGEATSDKYTIAQPMLAWPLWAVGEAYARIRGEPTDDEIAVASRRFVRRYNQFIALGIAVWVFRFLRRSGTGVRDAALGVLMLLFASMLLPHTKDFYSEPTWTLLSLVVLGLLARWVVDPARPRDVALGVFAATLAIWVNPTLVPALTVTAACSLAMRVRRMGVSGRGIVASVGIGGATLALASTILLVENTWRRGFAFDFGYSGEGFTTPLLEGLAGMLLSPTRGVLWFVPGLIPAAWAFVRRPARNPIPGFGILAGVYSATLILTYAKWHAWHGMWYWGPRFLLPVSVLAVAGMALAWSTRGERSSWEGRVLVAAIASSFWVYTHGIAVGQSDLVACLASTGDSPRCFWEWRFSPYAALVDAGALGRIATHRSTLVLAITAILFVGWWKWSARRPDRSEPGDRML